MPSHFVPQANYLQQVALIAKSGCGQNVVVRFKLHFMVAVVAAEQKYIFTDFVM